MLNSEEATVPEVTVVNSGTGIEQAIDHAATTDANVDPGLAQNLKDILQDPAPEVTAEAAASETAVVAPEADDDIAKLSRPATSKLPEVAAPKVDVPTEAPKAAPTKAATFKRWFYLVTAIIAAPLTVVLGGLSYLTRAIMDYRKARKAAKPVEPVAAVSAADRTKVDAPQSAEISFIQPLLKWKSVKDCAAYAASWGTDVDLANQYTHNVSKPKMKA